MGVCSVTGESSKANGVLSLLKGWVSSFWQQNSPSFLQSMRKVNGVYFIGHPFILSFEKKKNWNKSTSFGISKGEKKINFFFNDLIIGNK